MSKGKKFVNSLASNAGKNIANEKVVSNHKSTKPNLNELNENIKGLFFKINKLENSISKLN
ncbi:hypothetical protein [Thermohalobacter berrensis]|uniref:Uncharacterized protein n=1 Tax=Thermohalobacter berrensis TaxID=99594 RepID=A0A419T1C7_9FIRM|nr:hypothetical protein [Thermohalobacter berrensis]RKD31256.1 hypothetical protein BET03_03770 [Thermohalobacter berrensis]